VDTELIASYASRIRLNANTNLRLGAGVNYNTVRLDGNAMTPEQAGDPVLGRYLNSFVDMHILDFNLGLALTHRNYYLSYGAHNVNRGAIHSGDVFMDRKPATHIVQAGFRQALSKDFSVILNFMQRMQADLPDNTELNLKVLMLDRLWLGAGHRRDYANNFQLGLVLDRFRVGYIYELPSTRSYLLPNTTHEFTAVFNLFRPNGRRTVDEVLIW
jgi:type IX secretion system PorP/SprF family membrane protein